MDQWNSQGLNGMNGFKGTGADDSAVSVTPIRKEISETKTAVCFLHKNFSKDFEVLHFSLNHTYLFKTGFTSES